MPAWVYRHPEMTRLELERILLPSWQLLCHVSSLKQAGDYVTLDVGPESVFAVRDREGRIRAFHNVCRHRGARLLDGDGSCPGAITCPYHGWSYRHDGALLGVTARDTFRGLEKRRARPAASADGDRVRVRLRGAVGQPPARRADVGVHGG